MHVYIYMHIHNASQIHYEPYPLGALATVLVASSNSGVPFKNWRLEHKLLRFLQYEGLVCRYWHLHCCCTSCLLLMIVKMKRQEGEPWRDIFTDMKKLNATLDARKSTMSLWLWLNRCGCSGSLWPPVCAMSLILVIFDAGWRAPELISVAILVVAQVPNFLLLSSWLPSGKLT